MSADNQRQRHYSSLSSPSAMPPTTLTTVAVSSVSVSVSLPTNGFGGGYYEVDFQVPVYNEDHNPNVTKSINWDMIDQFVESTANVGSIYGFCFGACLVVYLFVPVLTPRSKMRLPFFIFYLLALTFETVRALVDTVRIGEIGLSPYSAYLALTGDIGSTNWSTGYIKMSIIKQTAAMLSYSFTATCLCMQAHGLLRNIRREHSYAYWAIMGILTSGSVATFVFDAMYTYSQIRGLQHNPTQYDFNALTSGSWMGLALSFMGWSSLSAGSVMYMIYTRIQLGIRGNGIYQFTIALLLVVTLDSFVVPITLCLVALTPNQFNVTRATTLVTPTVLALLPITFLFTTAHQKEMSRGLAADEDYGEERQR